MCVFFVLMAECLGLKLKDDLRDVRPIVIFDEKLFIF